MIIFLFQDKESYILLGVQKFISLAKPCRRVVHKPQSYLAVKFFENPGRRCSGSGPEINYNVIVPDSRSNKFSQLIYTIMQPRSINNCIMKSSCTARGRPVRLPRFWFFYSYHNRPFTSLRMGKNFLNLAFLLGTFFKVAFHYFSICFAILVRCLAFLPCTKIQGILD